MTALESAFPPAILRPEQAGDGLLIRKGPLSDRTDAMTDAASNPYLRDAILTATPEQLHLMLYDGAIRYALQARDAIEQKKFDVSYERLTRAQRIMLEMLNGLNYDVNRELCNRMASIYDFIYRKLLDGNLERNIAHIDDAVRVLRIERETWQLLVDKVNRDREVLSGENASGGHERVGDAATKEPAGQGESLCVQA